MQVLVVDDHHLMRDALIKVLGTLEGGAPLTALEASSPEEADRVLATATDIDLLVADLSYGNGIFRFDWIEDIKTRHPGLPVVVMSGNDSVDVIDHCQAIGASGFLPKTMQPAQIRAAMTLVLSGDLYFPVSRRDTAHLSPDLTDRQVDVLKELCAGKSGKEIARDLAIAESTVKTHVKAIYEALGVSNRVETLNAVRALPDLRRRIGLDD
jgi:DNA-binding NarL/FixJ family response regulator